MLNSTAKYTEKQLRQTIITEDIDGIILHYCLVKKQAKTLSFINNERLLIFNEKQGYVYYVNQVDTPFVSDKKIPKPKNDYAIVNVSIIKQIPNSSSISILYNRKNQKNQNVGCEWIFTFSANSLSAGWIKHIQQYKVAKLANILGTQSQSKLETIQNTIAFGLMGPKKEDDERMSKIEMNQKERKEQEEKEKALEKLRIEMERKREADKQKQLEKQRQLERQREYYRQKQLQRQKEQERQKQLQRKQIERKKQIQKQKQRQRSLQKERERRRLQEQRERQKRERELQSKHLSNKKYIQDPNMLTLGSSFIKMKNQSSRYEQQTLRESVLRYPILPNKNQNLKNDWNFKFISKPHESTLLSFEKQAIELFQQVVDDFKAGDAIRQYEKQGLIIYFVSQFSQSAPTLKRQFNNYHYLIQSQRNKILGVPLCIYVQYLGFTALIKASFPASAIKMTYGEKTASVLTGLQKQTKIKNEVLNGNDVVLLDLTDVYGSNDLLPRIYVDSLYSYLPKDPLSESALRPEYIIQNTYIYRESENTRQSGQDRHNLHKKIAQLSNYINEQPWVPTNCHDIRQLMHKNGLSMAHITKLYEQLKNKYIKKFIHTYMVSLIIKDKMQMAMGEVFNQKKQSRIQDILEYLFQCTMQGGNHDIWKKTTFQFKSKFSIPLNHHQIVPGFLFSCLVEIVMAEKDLRKIDKDKKLFEETNIIEKGFIRRVLPRIKRYDKYQSDETRKALAILETWKKQKNGEYESNENLSTVVKNQLCPENRSKILARLSKRIPSKANSYLSKQIYQLVNAQIPSGETQTITLSYLQELLRYEKVEQFKKVIEENINLVDYWMGDEHPQLCRMYECLAEFYDLKGEEETSLNFWKQSLVTEVRVGGTHTHAVGRKYEGLGDRQLKAGYKVEAMDSFLKAKVNLEGFGSLSPQYPVVLMKVAGLHLNFGDIENCISFCLQSLRLSENEKVEKVYLIKTYELLSRAYEINGDFEQLYDISVLCAKVFNRCPHLYIFDQMVRISLTGALYNLTPENQKRFAEIIESIQSERGTEDAGNKAINDLMLYAEQFVVMEKVLKYISMLERIAPQFKLDRHRRNIQQFQHLLQLVIKVVGIDFIHGILQQSE